MRNRYFYFLLIPAAAFIVVVGFGFWKQRQATKVLTTKNQPNTTVNGEQPYIFTEQAEAPDSDAAKRKNLNQALVNFRSATAFRATVTSNSSEGVTTGKIEYVKPLRLHATLTAPGNKEFDMIAIGQTVYLKQDKTTWGMVRDDSAKKFAEDFFTSVLKSEPTLASFGVPEDASLSTENDSAKKCTKFKTQYKTEQGMFDIDFCITDKKDIAYIRSQTQTGEMLNEYSDYNSLLIIERPVLPLLEYKVPITGYASSAR